LVKIGNRRGTEKTSTGGQGGNKRSDEMKVLQRIKSSSHTSQLLSMTAQKAWKEWVTITGRFPEKSTFNGCPQTEKKEVWGNARRGGFGARRCLESMNESRGSKKRLGG